MERNYCVRFVNAQRKTLAHCVVWAVCAALLIASTALGQQAGGTQGTSQPTQSGQAADGQQNSQLQDLSGQPQGAIDGQQQNDQDLFGEQQQQGLQRQDQLEPPRRYTQQGQLDQDTAQPGQTTMRQGALSGRDGTAGQPGELGVFLIEAGGPGVRVSSVVSGSAADEAGLQTGDVIMGINGQGVDQLQELIRMIRSIPAGEVANLRVWRDGQEQDVAATLQPLRGRERYQTNFRGESAGMNGDLAQRTQRLEQQLNMVMQELQRLRQEVMQLRGGGAGGLGTTGLDNQQPQGTATQPGQPGTQPLDQNATPPGLDRLPDQPDTTDTDTGLPF